MMCWVWVSMDMSVGVITVKKNITNFNVQNQGTLTYEDVTNVDSLGVGTFRNGIIVNTGNGLQGYWFESSRCRSHGNSTP